MKPIYKRVCLFIFLFICCSVAYYFGYTSVITSSSKNRPFSESILKSLNSKWKMLSHSILIKPSITTSKVNTTKPTTKAIRTVQTRNSCKICVPNDIPILLENRDVCNSHGKQNTQLDLFIIIFTQFKSKQQRKTIRNTWLQHTRNNTANVRYVFAFGRLPTNKENKALSDEAHIYKDIVQGDFKDSYRNLTYKTITMLGWVSKRCPLVKNVMKTDDDMWVNVPALVKQFTKYPLNRTVAGYCIMMAGPIRSKSSKWYVSYEEYTKDSYPGFCSGTGYVMDLNTAASIHKVSVDVPFLYLEDVYISLCIEHLGHGYHLQPINGFYNSKYQTKNLCDYHNFVLTSHYMSMESIENIWSAKC